MNLDLSQFHAVFFDEAAEHLATMESLLLHLDGAHPDPAQLEDLRRAAHSLKGSGATFGFRDLALLAETLETALAHLAGTAAALPSAAPAALRQACAALRQLLECARAGGPIDEAMRTSVRSATQRLREATDPEVPHTAAKVSRGSTAPDSPAAAVMTLVEAARPGQGGLEDITAAVRVLGEALERQADHLEDALDENARLRDELDALVAAIARLALPGVADARRRTRPVPKLRRTRRAGEDELK